MRIRLPELLEERALTAYALSVQAKGRLDMSTLYRVVRANGEMRYFDSDLLDALCDVLDVEPSELLERAPARKPGKRRKSA